MASQPVAPDKGRGATFNPQNRFEHHRRDTFDDGWEAPGEAEDAPAPLATTVTIQTSRTIISRNDSPDISFNQSINPYQGCEHGCIYCYARPSHAYLDLSPGLDFESRLFAKPDAAALLRAELGHPRYRCQAITVGANTDPYQPIEREWNITRQVLEVLAECRHPVAIITKSALVERDIDILAAMAKQNLAAVFVSITTLDRTLARRMEPRAAAPQRRLQAVSALSEAGIPVGVMVAPVIPTLNDRDLEAILEAAAAAGARSAGYVLLRLPHEVKSLFKDWLAKHYPLRAEHVMSLIRQMHGGKEYDSAWGVRQRGTGSFADLLEQRFTIACKRLDLNRERIQLETGLFKPPTSGKPSGQMCLF